MIAQSFQMLLVSVSNVLSESLLGGNCGRLDIQFDGRERLEKILHHLPINGVCCKILADRDTVLLAETRYSGSVSRVCIP